MQTIGIDDSRLNVMLPVILRELHRRGERKVAEMLTEALQSRSDLWEPPVGRRIIRTKRVLDKMGWSKTTLWRRVKAGSFPPPIRLGPNMNGWPEDVIDDIISGMAAEALK
jgi:prophage regulatory protein